MLLIITVSVCVGCGMVVVITYSWVYIHAEDRGALTASSSILCFRHSFLRTPEVIDCARLADQWASAVHYLYLVQPVPPSSGRVTSGYEFRSSGPQSVLSLLDCLSLSPTTSAVPSIQWNKVRGAVFMRIFQISYWNFGHFKNVRLLRNFLYK